MNLKSTIFTLLLLFAGARAATADDTRTAKGPLTPVPAPALAEVPDVSKFTKGAQMKAAITAAGFTPGFAASKEPPQAGRKFSVFAGQSPKAGEMKPPGTTVTVFIYMPAEPGVVPSLKDMTLDQAISSLPENMKITGDDNGGKPPTPEDANRIYFQDPPAGHRFARGVPNHVTVKRYGSGKDGGSGDTSSGNGPDKGSGDASDPYPWTFDGKLELPNQSGGQNLQLDMVVTISESGGKPAFSQRVVIGAGVFDFAEGTNATTTVNGGNLVHDVDAKMVGPVHTDLTFTSDSLTGSSKYNGPTNSIMTSGATYSFTAKRRR